METTRKWLLTALAMLTTTIGFSQTPLKGAAMGTNYDLAIGVRAGETSGLTIKKFTKSNQAFEGIMGVWNHGMSLTLLYEGYAPAFNVDGLNWYYGAGGHIAIKNRIYYRYYDRGRYYYYQYSNLGIGFDAIGGLEYKINKTPLAVNIDIKPYIEFVSGGGVWSSLDPGFGIKITF